MINIWSGCNFYDFWWRLYANGIWIAKELMLSSLIDQHIWTSTEHVHWDSTHTMLLCLKLKLPPFPSTILWTCSFSCNLGWQRPSCPKKSQPWLFRGSLPICQVEEKAWSSFVPAFNLLGPSFCYFSVLNIKILFVLWEKLRRLIWSFLACPLLFLTRVALILC